ncbi:SCP2 sterol-binding domain-containing protein, partial [Blyttiomyces helicus]
VEVPGYISSAVFAQIAAGVAGASPDQKAGFIKKVKAIFQFDIKGADGKIQTWTLNLKNDFGLTVGAGSAKADIVITVADKDFSDLAAGKINGQKAFMTGKLKVKGNMMLATSKCAELSDGSVCSLFLARGLGGGGGGVGAPPPPPPLMEQARGLA